MKTIIFDLDGTILDTLVDLKNAVNHSLKFYNLPQKSLEFVRLAIGNGTTVLIKRCTPETLSEEKRRQVFALFKSYYLAHYADNTRPDEGIKEMLSSLKPYARLAVVSNKDDDLTKRLIEKEFPGLFDIVQGSYLDKPKKPDSYLLNKIIASSCLLRDECLYIGDTDVDKMTATNASLPYLLVNYGYRTKAELEKMCPDDTTISDIPTLYNKILKWVNS